MNVNLFQFIVIDCHQNKKKKQSTLDCHFVLSERRRQKLCMLGSGSETNKPICSCNLWSRVICFSVASPVVRLTAILVVAYAALRRDALVDAAQS